MAEAEAPANNGNGAASTKTVEQPAGECERTDVSAAKPTETNDAAGTEGKAESSAAKAAARPVPTVKRASFPSILGELNLKVVEKGILLPESRKTFFRRRSQLRQNSLLAAPSAVAAIADGDRARKRKPGRSVGVQLEELESDLFHCAFTGDGDRCHSAIRAGADVNVRTNADLDGVGTGATALHVAAARGFEDVVEQLLQAGADPTAISGRGEGPIQVAARMGHINIVKILRQIGAHPMDDAGNKKLIQSAPSWDDRKRRKLQSLLGPTPPTWQDRSDRGSQNTGRSIRAERTNRQDVHDSSRWEDDTRHAQSWGGKDDDDEGYNDRTFEVEDRKATGKVGEQSRKGGFREDEKGGKGGSRKGKGGKSGKGKGGKHGSESRHPAGKTGRRQDPT